MIREKTTRIIHLFTLLRNRDFGLLWSGQALSQLGDALFTVAQGWLMLQLTGSAMAMSAMMLFNLLPSLLFMLIGGVSVDRYNRRWIAILSDILRATSTALFGWLVWSGNIQAWHIYLLSVIYGSTRAFFNTAKTALVPMILEQEQVLSANSLDISTYHLCGIVGPLLGGILVDHIGIGGVAFINALSFIISVITLWGVRVPSHSAPVSSTADRSFWQEIATGWNYVRRNRALLTLLIALIVVNFGALPLGVHLPVFVERSLHSDVQTLGLLSSSVEGGKFIGSLATGALGEISQPGPFILSAFLVQSLVQIAFALTSNVTPAALLFAVIGLFQASGLVVLTTTFQTAVPDDLRGRVISIFEFVSMSLMPVSLILWGFIADAISVVLVFILGSSIMAFAIVAGLLTFKMRRLSLSMIRNPENLD